MRKTQRKLGMPTGGKVHRNLNFTMPKKLGKATASAAHVVGKRKRAAP